MSEREIREEIDLIEQLRVIWNGRRVVALMTGIALFLGVIVALCMPKEYEASCDVVPQPSGSATSSGVSSLAALAGISVSALGDEGRLSPYLYENIFNSVRFRKELLGAEIYNPRQGVPSSLADFLLRPHSNPVSDTTATAYGAFDVVSARDYTLLKELERRLTITLDDKRGALTLTATMPEALVAAQVVDLATEQLQRYITRLKIEKVQSNLDFIAERYKVARQEFESVQSRRARFRDANRNTTRYGALSELESLNAEYALAKSLFNELAMQLEQAKIKVCETMPILTIINPVSVPFRRAKPRRAMIVALAAIIGFVVGSAIVLSLPAIAQSTGHEELLRLFDSERSAP